MGDKTYVYDKIIVPWVDTQMRIKRRRETWKVFFNLTRRFHEIGENRYVKEARGL